jgi:subtilase family serine protease
MRLKNLFTFVAITLFAIIPAISSRLSGQSNVAQSRITQPADGGQLTVLQGNVHPMARAAFDRGAAPASLPMDHMMLVLTRSPQQQAALDALLAQQQDKSSPNYHKWLTPEQFGQQYGPSDQDVQKVTAWLESQGLSVNKVANGRTTIDFSGTAGQVQQAFHTAMHSYVMTDGTQRWANATNPSIPSALATVVGGVASLNNFPRHKMSRTFGVVRKDTKTGKMARLAPQFTYAGGCNGTGTNCFALGPGDFATIYNVPATINSATPGTGQIIAIVSDSDINLSDLTSFRSIFGLPAATFNTIVPPGSTDPGVQFNNVNSDEEEAILDAEWSGAVAPGATIDLVSAATTTTTFGGDAAAVFVVDCQVTSSSCSAALPAKILSYSYGACELFLGTSGNQFYQGLWSQAASEGITVLASTGDSGSAGCDDPNENEPAEYGIAVNGVGSTPYNLAVGGTDFNDLTLAQANTYFNASNNGTTQASAIGYIPETTWNDTCTNSIIYGDANNLFGFGTFSSAVTACNNANVQNDGFLAPVGGSGGPSNCTTSSATASTVGTEVASCGGGYSKPVWQTGPGVPSDGKRDVPDVSLFAGDGVIQNFYAVCEEDLAETYSGVFATCNLGSPFEDFVEAGGTSVSVQAFAGIVAILNQKTGSAQGLLNPTLYTLAAEQTTSACNATGSPASTCVFYDVTSGTNAMPCVLISGVPNCGAIGSAVGALSGYSATTGFDLATGLGSVNVGNLVGKMGANFYLTSSSSSVTATSSAPGTVTITATSVNGFAGSVALTCSTPPTGASCSFAPSTISLAANGTATSTLTITKSSSQLIPSFFRKNPRGWNGLAELTSSAVLLAGILLVAFSPAQRRWSTALALMAFALLIGTAACGGGSSSSSTTTSTSNPVTGNTVITGTGGGNSYPLTINVTVD